MPTTYLNLCNEVLRRINEVPIAQADFSSVRGVQAVAKDVVNRSIEGINQDEFEWPFNVGNGSQLLVVGQEDYNWPADLQVPKWDTFHIVKDDALNVQGHQLKFISRDAWHKWEKDQDDAAGAEGRNVPLYVFEKHGNGFTVSPSPDEAYTVTYEYFINPVPLVDYDDEPTIPSIYDEAIIKGALYHLYIFRDNEALSTRADKDYRKRVDRMRTLLINKEDTVRSTMIARNSYFGYNADYAYPFRS